MLKNILFVFIAITTNQTVLANVPQTGFASWYGPGFHGKRTASGERFNQHALTAAHKTLPLGSKVKVTNLKTKKTVVVTINDRGPYSRGRIIDLSRGSARVLGIKGTERVSIARIN